MEFSPLKCVFYLNSKNKQVSNRQFQIHIIYVQQNK